jgi:hypothetical protein
MKKPFSISPLLLACLAGSAHSAPGLNDAESLGAQAGAMEYCRDNFSSDSKTRNQYDALRSAYIKDFDQLAGNDKQRALQIAGVVGKKGNVGGKKLSESRCDQIRKGALREKLRGQ